MTRHLSFYITRIILWEHHCLEWPIFVLIFLLVFPHKFLSMLGIFAPTLDHRHSWDHGYNILSNLSKISWNVPCKSGSNFGDSSDRLAFLPSHRADVLCPKAHRGSTSEIVESTQLECVYWGQEHEVCSASGLSALIENAGFLGAILGSISFFSIDKTSNMDGLSSCFSCTHNRPIPMHLISLHPETESSNAGSMNSMPLPSIHSSYAWHC